MSVRAHPMDSQWIASIAARSISSDGQRIPSKLERIEKRNSKKRLRCERKKIGPPLPPSSSSNPAITPNHTKTYSPKGNEKNLSKLAISLKRSLQRIHNSDTNATKTAGYTDPEAEFKGKAVSRQQLTMENIQPIKSCYGGLGLARPSLLLSLRDPSFIPKMEEEFSERE